MPELTTQQLLSLDQYTRLRDAARNAVQHGVYPNAKAALAAYVALTDALTGDLSEWQATHDATTAAVQPAIASLQAGLQQIIAGLEAVAAADVTIFPSISAAIGAGEEEE